MSTYTVKLAPRQEVAKASEKVLIHLSPFYSNRHPEGTLFLQELSEPESINREFSLISRYSGIEYINVHSH